MTVVSKRQAQLRQALQEALEAARASGEMALEEVPRIELETPRDQGHGDYASNIALMIAKEVGKAPRDAAAIIVRHLPQSDLIREVQVAGPGFINFYLNKDWLYEVLEVIDREGLNYGNCDHGRGEKVLLEFVSANPVGPLNVVNARSAAVGSTLAHLLKAVGYAVGTEFYVNDAGNQASVFAASLEARFQRISNPDYPFPSDGYPGAYLGELAAVLNKEHPDLGKLPLEERLAFCKQWGTDQMVAAQKSDLEDYGVKFDNWFRERDLHRAEALEKIIADFRERNLAYTEDNALWFCSSKFGDDKDRVMVKSDQSYTYITADIAYHLDKLKRGYTKLINILGPDHHGYIGRMKAAIEALGYPRDALEILILQYVALLRDGEQVKMSKRAGEFITMQDLVSEVGKDAARFFFLHRSPESHLDFDLDLAVEQSNENPVFYVQYAHARIASVLRQAQDMGIALPACGQVCLSELQNEAEIALLKQLADLPREVLAAALNREPHRLTRYALELAGLFHSFYSHHRILGEREELRSARLFLALCVQTVLKKVLSLLGVSAPEQM